MHTLRRQVDDVDFFRPVVSPVLASSKFSNRTLTHG
jgi:hypothetical protein